MNASTSPVNPIRQIPGAGLSVMGARTLKQDGTANKYVNMRRSLIYIRKNLKNLTEFAIFENNDERLWSRINTATGSFLNEYRNQGGLRGATAAQAYFVKCDAENNSAQTIANGEVHIQIGVALQYPAEFIVIDLSQKTLN
jgi:phage tail sheath protein FI